MTEPPPAPVDSGKKPAGRGRPPLGVLIASVVAGLAIGIGVPLGISEYLDETEPVVATTGAVEVVRAEGELVVADPVDRDIASYAGYGTWVDVFDFSPPYAGDSPSVTPADLATMAASGVETVYLQAARLDDRSPDGLEDPFLLAEMLLDAHAAGMDVVAWYLPRWSADATDLGRLRSLEGFEVLGQRFDGVAVDIEWTGDDVDTETRNERLVEMSRRYRDEFPDDPFGAIVLPPVLIEVVNDQFWPDFPWTDIAGEYDVWLPMSYWSFRSDASGYGDGYAYNQESVQRLRDNLGDPDAVVHSIGGIGALDGVDDPPDPPEPLGTFAEVEAFARSLTDTDSIGGSIYDWATLEPPLREPTAAAITGALGG